MNCSASESSMMKYFDGEYNDIENAQFKQHLKGCKKCSEEFESLKAVFGYLETKVDIEPPPDFEAAVMNRINALEQARREKTERALVIIYWAATLALGALFTLFVFDAGEVFLKLLLQVGNGFGIMSEIDGVLKIFYGIFEGIFEVLLEIGIVISNIYQYIIAAAILLLVMIKNDFGASRRKMQANTNRTSTK